MEVRPSAIDRQQRYEHVLKILGQWRGIAQSNLRIDLSYVWQNYFLGYVKSIKISCIFWKKWPFFGNFRDTPTLIAPKSTFYCFFINKFPQIYKKVLKNFLPKMGNQPPNTVMLGFLPKMKTFPSKKVLQIFALNDFATFSAKHPIFGLFSSMEQFQLSILSLSFLLSRGNLQLSIHFWDFSADQGIINITSCSRVFVQSKMSC